MIPGSWLEVSNYDSIKAAAIYSQGFVKNFIVQEKSAESVPEFPFLLLISDPVEAQSSRWKLHASFQGFLWRTDTIPSVLTSPPLEKMWLDYHVTNLKKAEVCLPHLKNMPLLGYFISSSDKISSRKISKLIEKFTLKISTRPHDLIDSDFQNWEELEDFKEPEININTSTNPQLSIIIPHFEGAHFLCNVLKHLEKAVPYSPPFEVIVVDDASSEKSFRQVCYFAHRQLANLPLQISRWNKNHNLKSGEKVFRAGASRNWGAALAKSENLLFLDADMITPKEIVSTVLKSLTKHDVIQFVRKHVPAHLSSETSSYDELINSEDLYIEESAYWNSLFEASHWAQLPDFWKYTCTYALALKKETFMKTGRIRRNFIRYGFEDTDLGYRLFRHNCSFALNKMPLLHLTAKAERTQGFLFKLYKMNRISPMAKTFFKLNLDPAIYNKFQSLLD